MQIIDLVQGMPQEDMGMRFPSDEISIPGISGELPLANCAIRGPSSAVRRLWPIVRGLWSVVYGLPALVPPRANLRI